MTGQNWQVLIVEDEPDSMELLGGLLGHHGITFFAAKSAEEALSMLPNLSPTLILIDLSLPGKNGWELLQILRDDQAYSQIPRVAVTAYHTAELAEHAIEAGFNAYFAKPITANTFVNELKAVMADIN
ncbi:MAG: response regulator [Chloroflexi bacterium]|nr:response regulator [Chloroflexota bacterium]